MTMLRWLIALWLASLLLFPMTGAPPRAEPLAPATEKSLQTESALERRVRHLSSQLRCPVCQGESVYDSHADVAVEMKALIKDKLRQGESEAEIIAYFQARYGNFILMAPPAEGIHWLIWVFPALLGVLALLFVFRLFGTSQSKQERDEQGANDPNSKTPPAAVETDIEKLEL